MQDLCRHTFKHCKKYLQKKKHIQLSWGTRWQSRKDAVRLAQIRSGHYHALMHSFIDPTCFNCSQATHTM